MQKYAKLFAATAKQFALIKANPRPPLHDFVVFRGSCTKCGRAARKKDEKTSWHGSCIVYLLPKSLSLRTAPERGGRVVPQGGKRYGKS